MLVNIVKYTLQNYNKSVTGACNFKQEYVI